jgi:hypothetical protein
MMSERTPPQAEGEPHTDGDSDSDSDSDSDRSSGVGDDLGHRP